MVKPYYQLVNHFDGTYLWIVHIEARCHHSLLVLSPGGAVNYRVVCEWPFHLWDDNLDRANIQVGLVVGHHSVFV